MTTPFSLRALISRITAVARRAAAAEEPEQKRLLNAGISIDRHRVEIRWRGRRIELTAKEVELLATLGGDPGRVFGRADPLDVVWGRDGFVEPRTADAHLARLRAKFAAPGVPTPALKTVRGVGYRGKDPAGRRINTAGTPP